MRILLTGGSGQLGRALQSTPCEHEMISPPKEHIFRAVMIGEIL